MCVEVCPSGALYLVDGQAVWDPGLCRECEACVAACLEGAICLGGQAHTASTVAPLVLRTESKVVPVRSVPIAVPLRARVLPAVGAALLWAGREIVPRLADHWLDILNRQPAERLPAGNRLAEQAGRKQQGPYRHRRRRRGRSEQR